MPQRPIALACLPLPRSRRFAQARRMCFALAILLPTSALAETPARYCRQVRVDDTLRPIPDSLAAPARKLFGLAMPADQVRRSTYFRCAEGRVLICNTGANLPCGKANTSRSIAGAAAYCRENPGSDFIPMAATGHDTIYRWRCVGRTARPQGPVEPVDGRGFIARYWRRLN